MYQVLDTFLVNSWTSHLLKFYLIPVLYDAQLDSNRQLPAGFHALKVTL